jgi:hypothetical protein
VAISDISTELTVVLGSSKSPEVVLLDENGQPEDLTDATDSSFVLYDDSVNGQALMTRRSDDTPTPTCSVNIPNSKVLFTPPTEDEMVGAAVITEIDEEAGSLKLTGDHTARVGLQPGREIEVQPDGLADSSNAGAYVIQSIELDGSDTLVFIKSGAAADDFSSSEPAITGRATWRADLSPGRFIGYVAIKVDGTWWESEPFFVTLVASKAPTF